ncbi:MAG: chemotaxis protein CheX [Frankiaceae bacterium]
MRIKTRTPDQPSAATDEQIEGIAQEVWTAFTGISIEQATAALDRIAATVEVVTGTVHVDGEWRGRIQITCDMSLAKPAATAMFAKLAEEISAEDIADALGELTNMIGGNIKSILPSPSRLSLPIVTTGPETATAPAGANQTNSITLTCREGRLNVTVCHLQDDHRNTALLRPPHDLPFEAQITTP